jgi:PAS domain S-box-containing protein
MTTFRTPVALRPDSSDVDLPVAGAWDDGQFAALVANVPGAVYRGTLSADWDVQFMSAEVEWICGYPASDFLGLPAARTFASIIHPEDRDLVARAVDEALERREPFIIDYRIIHAAGEIRWVHERGRGVFGDDGTIQFLDGVLFDHTEQRRLEEQHRLLFEHNPQPMFVYDRETLEIVAVSDATTDYYGYSREQLLTMTIRDLVPPEDLPAVDEYLANQLRGERPGRVIAHAWRHRYADGTIVDVEITSDDLELSGRTCRILLCQDVTDRRRAALEIATARDEAVEASNMKSAFLANMSHEIRTPMNGVLGMNELLLETDLTDQQRSYADQVAASGEQMLSIINDILDISKIETGHLELDLVEFALPTAIRDTCAAPRLAADVKGLALTVDVAPDVPARVRGDARRLRQVLLNLVANAVKFTSQGGVTVRVTNRQQGAAHAVVRFEICDTGIGIDSGEITRMFDAFTQADASVTRNYGGTGLGLAIARELVEGMGGVIGADSTLGGGSTFWFELAFATLASAEPIAPPRAVEHAAVAEQPPDGPLVLIVEDSQVNMIVAVRAIERCGCRTHTAGDGLLALEALAQTDYDAVLMDCQMPNMDGYEATAELRRREGDARHTPVIAMTAHAMAGDEERCLAAGMDAYLTKPMRREDLTATLARFLPQLSELAAADAADA